MNMLNCKVKDVNTRMVDMLVVLLGDVVYFFCLLEALLTEIEVLYVSCKDPGLMSWIVMCPSFMCKHL